MRRRNFVLATATVSMASVWQAAHAHHGWSSFDQDRPIYLEGKVARVKWQNPHAEFDLDVPAGLKVPADLAQRTVPAQTAPIDAQAILAKAAAPNRKDRRWEIELAPLTRTDAWKLAPLKPGMHVSVVGFIFREEKGEPILRAEFLFVDGKAYGLRSGPA